VPTAPAPSAPLTETHQPDGPTPDTTLAATTYALNLPTSTVDSELQKRQARAARFGTTAEPDSENIDSEASRALERAKRFGTTGGENSAMGKLDEALPMKRERGGDRPGRGGGKRGRGGRDVRQGSQGPVGVTKRQPAYVSERDKAAAEARRKKFGG
jgi:SAP domain-containing ribonucleoprotein